MSLLVKLSCPSVHSIRASSSLTNVYKKMQSCFLKPAVFKLLQATMIIDPDIVHSRDLQKVETPTIQLLTDTQLKEVSFSSL